MIRNILLLAGVRERVEAALGGPLDGEPKIHLVREVAPNKRMLCVSFELPAAIAGIESNAAPQAEQQQSEPQPPPAKKART